MNKNKVFDKKEVAHISKVANDNIIKSTGKRLKVIDNIGEYLGVEWIK